MPAIRLITFEATDTLASNQQQTRSSKQEHAETTRVIGETSEIAPRPARPFPRPPREVLVEHCARRRTVRNIEHTRLQQCIYI
eukprot:2675390-Lingulodinium_polyedra.AAC.1